MKITKYYSKKRISIYDVMLYMLCLIIINFPFVFQAGFLLGMGSWLLLLPALSLLYSASVQWREIRRETYYAALHPTQGVWRQVLLVVFTFVSLVALGLLVEAGLPFFNLLNGIIPLGMLAPLGLGLLLTIYFFESILWLSRLLRSDHPSSAQEASLALDLLLRFMLGVLMITAIILTTKIFLAVWMIGVAFATSLFLFGIERKLKPYFNHRNDKIFRRRGVHFYVKANANANFYECKKDASRMQLSIEKQDYKGLRNTKESPSIDYKKIQDFMTFADQCWETKITDMYFRKACIVFVMLFFHQNGIRSLSAAQLTPIQRDEESLTIVTADEKDFMVQSDISVVNDHLVCSMKAENYLIYDHELMNKEKKAIYFFEESEVQIPIEEIVKEMQENYPQFEEIFENERFESTCQAIENKKTLFVLQEVVFDVKLNFAVDDSGAITPEDFRDKHAKLVQSLDKKTRQQEDSKIKIFKEDPRPEEGSNLIGCRRYFNFKPSHSELFKIKRKENQEYTRISKDTHDPSANYTITGWSCRGDRQGG